MPRYKTFKGLLVLSCLMLTASAERQTREEPGPTSRLAVQDKRGNSNPVIHWNRIANEIFPVDVGPVLDSRAMAILHAAIHDAVNGIEASLRTLHRRPLVPWSVTRCCRRQRGSRRDARPDTQSAATNRAGVRRRVG